jgi:hypothetical protein
MFYFLSHPDWKEREKKKKERENIGNKTRRRS